jgi:hypothetical protein
VSGTGLRAKVNSYNAETIPLFFVDRHRSQKWKTGFGL